MFERIKKWYRQGLWNRNMVWQAVQKGYISEEQFRAVVGEV